MVSRVVEAMAVAKRLRILELRVILKERVMAFLRGQGIMNVIVEVRSKVSKE